jgi:hypothetical protein
MPSKNIVDFANQVKSYALGMKDQQVLGAWNLLPIMVESQNINNVSFTVNSDKSITTHRTATSSSSSILYLADNDHVYTLPKGKYYLSDGKPVNSEAWIFVSLVNGTTIVAQNIVTTENGEAVFDTSSYTYDKMYIGVRISKDQTEDVTFKPMISLEPNQHYVPYAMTNRELTNGIQLNDGTTTYWKFGKLVIMRVGAWTTASGFTIPDGFRPAATQYNVGEQRDTNNVVSFKRVTLSNNGTVSLSDSNTQFIGTFVYGTS